MVLREHRWYGTEHEHRAYEWYYVLRVANGERVRIRYTPSGDGYD